jgi:long-chain fatty acid transport protein
VKTILKHELVFSVMLALLIHSTLVSAEALRNQPPGSYGWVRAGGKIAHIDDASAVAINPANLSDIKKSTLVFAPALDYVTADIKIPSGAKVSTKNNLHLIPSFFASSPSKRQPALTWGFGISVPYGQAIEYDENFPFRYLSPHFSELAVVNFTPALAYRINDQLSVGGSLNLGWSQLELRQAFPWNLATGIPEATDGDMRFKGDGTGISIDFGVTWQATDRQRLAATYKSSMRINYDGDFKISNVPSPAASALGVTPTSRFQTTIDYPSIVTLGYGIEINDRLKIGVDVERVEWSTINEFNLDVANNAVLFPSTIIPADWHDTTTYGFGLDYMLTGGRFIRAGFWHLQNPIPAINQQPNLPESDQNVYTIGYGFNHNNHRIEFSYGFVDYESRTISNNVNPAFNGVYDKEAHIFALTWRYNR